MDTIVPPASPPVVPCGHMRFVAIRLTLLLAFAALTALILTATTGARFSLALTPQLSAFYFIPVNIIGLWLLVRHGRSTGQSLSDMLNFDSTRIGRDFLMGLLWLFVLFIPFTITINLVMVLLYGPANLFAGFETVFAPDPSQLVALPAWFAWSAAILTALLFPLTNAPAEELIYRGHAQTRLKRHGHPAWTAIAISAAAFGLQHILLAPSAPAMLVYGAAFTVWGAGAGIIYNRTGRLMPLVFAHFVTNFMFGVVPVILLAFGIA